VTQARARLAVEALTAEAFAPFGEVISTDAARTTYAVNDGNSQRFHALGHVECAGGAAVLSIFRAQPRPLPFAVAMLERHPLGSQAFVPLSKTPYLVVVATDPSATPRAFLATNGQGVNFFRGTWHHPLLALERESDFLVVDREGDGGNCDEQALPHAWELAPWEGL
jgi:ureidoglycolate lyase